jgi:hypothetical protein
MLVCLSDVFFVACLLSLLIDTFVFSISRFDPLSKKLVSIEYVYWVIKLSTTVVRHQPRIIVLWILKKSIIWHLSAEPEKVLCQSMCHRDHRPGQEIEKHFLFTFKSKITNHT